jgi:4-phosphopantoate--beta-alanine ligase
MGKTVITIDLNPLSRTSQTADITIVDNLIRTMPNLCKWVDEMKNLDVNTLQDMVKEWNNSENLHHVKQYMAKRLNSLA